MTCDNCGASLSGVGRWVLPGVRRLCEACKEPPRAVTVRAVEVMSGLRFERAKIERGKN